MQANVNLNKCANDVSLWINNGKNCRNSGNSAWRALKKVHFNIMLPHTILYGLPIFQSAPFLLRSCYFE